MAKAPKKKKCSNSDDNITKTTIARNGCANSSSNTKVKRSRKSLPRESPFQRSSKYRGVTRHRLTGRYEAHLWDKDGWNDSRKKKGKQVYLGAYNDEAAAARAYDLAALKYLGKDTILNFPLSDYENDMKGMDGLSREEYLGSLRRKSNGFSRGVSKYRGVARHHNNGRWEARLGRVLGNRYLYLGTYATQEEAATAYDIAAIEHRGLNAVTNFDLSRYMHLVKSSNNSSDEQPSLDIVDQSKLILEVDSRASTSSNQSFLEYTFEQPNDQVDDAISIEGFMWGQPPSADDCIPTLVDHFSEYDMLCQDQSDKESYTTYMEGQNSWTNNVINNYKDIFSEDLMWGQPPSADDCIPTLIDHFSEYDLLCHDQTDNKLHTTYVEGQISWTNNVINNYEDIFSEDLMWGQPPSADDCIPTLVDHLCEYDMLCHDQTDIRLYTTYMEGQNSWTNNVVNNYNDIFSEDLMCVQPPPADDCIPTLADHFSEYDMLCHDQTDNKLYTTYMEGQSSWTNNVINNYKDIFSDLDSLLCDFDKMEATHIEI